MIKYKDNNKAHIKSIDSYQKEYEYSIHDNNQFWSEKAERITWIKKWDNVSHVDYTKAEISWYNGAKLNVSYNCIDRHVESGKGEQAAIIWEGNNPDESITLTYKELLKKVSSFSNVLKKHNIKIIRTHRMIQDTFFNIYKSRKYSFLYKFIFSISSFFIIIFNKRKSSSLLFVCKPIK